MRRESRSDTSGMVGGDGVSDDGRKLVWPANLSAMSLPELIQHALDNGRSARQIADAGGISHPTVSKWAKATATDTIDDRTIDGLATGLGLRRDIVYRAALGIPAPRPFTLPTRAARLNDKERRAVLSVVDAILARADPDAVRVPAARRLGSVSDPAVSIPEAARKGTRRTTSRTQGDEAPTDD